MKTSRINADKPHLWKADIAASVDRFNEWFMRFAPEAFRSTRVKTAEHVKAALFATNDLRSLNADTLKANPAALPTLRMCTAPPLAVDRLIGLASANKSLIGCMEEGNEAGTARGAPRLGLPRADQTARPRHLPLARQWEGADRPRARPCFHHRRGSAVQRRGQPDRPQRSGAAPTRHDLAISSTSGATGSSPTPPGSR